MENLGAKFSIDISDLKAGLSQANRLIKESNSEFKAAAAGIDDWQNSEDGLNAKLKQLSSTLNVQKEVLKAYEEQYREAGYAQDDMSKEAVELRTKINNQKAAIAETEKETAKYSEALDEVKNNSTEAGKAAKQSGDDAEKGSKGWAKFGEVAKNAAKFAAAAIAAAGAAVVGLTKSAIDSYADYEQLVGGVDTLFGKSSQTVQDYAANAYKTAGMSANEYMETVTGFSASLISSLGGDTKKAAKYADMAISDMSDNANKMGSDIESIQNAYGGFAKQNYTMLDNLKLGYGGTKEEMERLLKDAQKISGVKYDISSYSDIVDAIHVVQDEMGITGTTAKEASETISGSVSSMKSAWGNLLTGLADDNADFDGLIQNFVDSVATAVKNILPRVSIIVAGLVNLVNALMPQIPPLLMQLLPVLSDGVMTLIQGLVSVLPQVIAAITSMLPQLINSLLGMLPSILTAIVTIITQLIIALSEMLPSIVNSIMEVLPLLITSLINSIPQLIEAAIQLLMAIVEAIPTIMKALQNSMPQIISTIISVLLANLPMLLKAAIQLFLAIVTAIPQVIPVIVKQLPTIIKGIVGGIRDGIPEMLKAGGDLIKGLWNGISDMKDWIIGKVKGFGENVLGGLKDFFGIHSPSRVMKDQIGKNLALGIGEGFTDNIKSVNEDIQGAMQLDDVNVNANINKNGVAREGKSIVVNQTNNYSQAHSRYELYKSKQQTAAAVRLALQGG